MKLVTRHLRDTYILNLKESIVEARNIAVKEKKDKQKHGDHGRGDDIPSDILIPNYYDESSVFSTNKP